MPNFNEKLVMEPEPDRGFTMIELLIVIVILGILAGIVVFAVGRSTDTATNDACSGEGRSFASAIAAAPVNNPPIALDGDDAAADAATLKAAGLVRTATPRYLDDSEGGPYATGWTYADGVVETDGCA